MSWKTEQEAFWAGEFGDGYIERNRSDALARANRHLFATILSRHPGMDSFVELGCNIGMNLSALHEIDPDAVLHGVEINEKAAAKAAARGIASIHTGSILEPLAIAPAACSFTKGVLIHIAPEQLHAAYDNLLALSRRYVMVIEYYNPNPVSVPYRGHQDRLFKRDFAGELIDQHALKLVDYGFAYHRDRLFSQDDLTWFLLEK
jgi:pseudaminic acid biosynthesis-associated methylase